MAARLAAYLRLLRSPNIIIIMRTIIFLLSTSRPCSIQRPMKALLLPSGLPWAWVLIGDSGKAMPAGDA